MNTETLLSYVDHTLLSPKAAWEEIRALCLEGLNYHTASVCIPPCYVSQAKKLLKDQLPICTVIGFPHGNSTTASKVFETQDAVENGADEIDMVINIGWLKDGLDGQVLEEIRQVRQACKDQILKVIIETCLLTQEEKIRMCEIVTQSGADFIKTSTGFAGGGATLSDIQLFASHVGPNVKIKAAGGISSLEDAEAMIEAGASRLGTSRIVSLISTPAAPR